MLVDPVVGFVGKSVIVGGALAGGLHAVSGPDHFPALLPRCMGQKLMPAAKIGVCVCVCVCVCMCTRVRIRVCVCARARARACVRACVHVCTCSYTLSCTRCEQVFYTYWHAYRLAVGFGACYVSYGDGFSDIPAQGTYNFVQHGAGGGGLRCRHCYW